MRDITIIFSLNTGIGGASAMANVDVYQTFDPSINKYYFSIFLNVTSVSATSFIDTNPVSLFPYTAIYSGNYVLLNRQIVGGTINELNILDSSGKEVYDIKGLNAPVTGNGFSFSFQDGDILTTGNTYTALGPNTYMSGYGNDTYIANSGSTVHPGPGLNTITTSGTGVTVNFDGSLNSYVVITGSNGQLSLIDKTDNRNGADNFNVTGSTIIKFFGDSSQINDDSGVLSLQTNAGEAVSSGSGFFSKITITDSANNIESHLDGLKTLSAPGKTLAINLTDSGTPTLKVTAAQLTADAPVLADIAGTYTLTVSGVNAAGASSMLAQANVTAVGVTDSAANVMTNLDNLQTLATAGKLTSIVLTGSGPQVLSLTPAQLSGDAAALGAITSSFAVSIDASAANLTINGLAGHANTVQFSGAASQYSVTANGDGAGFTVTDTGTGRSSVDHLSNITQIQFSDKTLTLAASGTLNQFLALLYQGALGRSPDAGGLASWEQYAGTLPATAQTEGANGLWDPAVYNGAPSIASDFVNSTEFQSKYGKLDNTQFITQLYANVLDRQPDAAGLTAWVTAMNGGTAKGQALVGFADSPEALANATNGYTGQSGTHAAWLFLV